MELTPLRSKNSSRWGRSLNPRWARSTDPWWGRNVDQDFSVLQREMNEVMDSFFGRSSLTVPQVYNMDFYPAVDVQEKEDKYVLEAELPGMSEDNIELDLHNNILTITGERKLEEKKSEKGYTHTERYFGSFRRDIPFEEAVNPDKIKAELKSGILSIELPKIEKGKKTHKKIEIKH